MSSLPEKVYRVGDSPPATQTRPAAEGGLQMGGFVSAFNKDRYTPWLEEGSPTHGYPTTTDYLLNELYPLKKDVEVVLAEPSTLLMTLVTMVYAGGPDRRIRLLFTIGTKFVSAESWGPISTQSGTEVNSCLYAVTSLPAGTHTIKVEAMVPHSEEYSPAIIDGWFTYFVGPHTGGEDLS